MRGIVGQDVKITEQNLERFTTWLMERGRSSGTAALYVSNLRMCASDAKGITHRLIAGALAPNSLRTNLAALRSWALYSKDEELRQRLADLRLPPARRLRDKAPLPIDDLRRVLHQVQTDESKVNTEPKRQVVLIMALRGLRSGDILRMRRSEVERALSTGKLTYEGKGRKRLEFDATPILEPLRVLYSYPGWTRVAELVTTSENPKVASKAIWRASRRMAKKVGIDEMNPHRFRHTFATRYLDRLAGDPNAIVKLQKFMGWESMTTAARYVDAVSQADLDRIGQDLASGLVSSGADRRSPSGRRSRT
jgi:integrase